MLYEHGMHSIPRSKRPSGRDFYAPEDGTPGRFKIGLAIGGQLPHDSQG
jgi:hypothetical protein